MKLAVYTDGLAHLDIEGVAQFCSQAEIDGVELGCGNWSPAPHVELDRLLGSEAARTELVDALTDSGVEITMLNCSGNQLDPGPNGALHAATMRKTIELAGLLGHDTIVAMSGLPGALPTDQAANWITTTWPPENLERLEYQWMEVAIPFWREMVRYAHDHGVNRIALENHGHQLVYNSTTLLRLRDAVGSAIGANLDPSHLLWMGGDPVETVRRLGPAIFHLHAKDTIIRSGHATDGCLSDEPHGTSTRSWEYAAPGQGHDGQWWEQFITEAATHTQARAISIEHSNQAEIAEAAKMLRGLAILGG